MILNWYWFFGGFFSEKWWLDQASRRDVHLHIHVICHLTLITKKCIFKNVSLIIQLLHTGTQIIHLWIVNTSGNLKEVSALLLGKYTPPSTFVQTFVDIPDIYMLVLENVNMIYTYIVVVWYGFIYYRAVVILILQHFLWQTFLNLHILLKMLMRRCSSDITMSIPSGIGSSIHIHPLFPYFIMKMLVYEL